VKWRSSGLPLAVVRDVLAEHRASATEEELTDFETDVLAGFVLARASAGMTGGERTVDNPRLSRSSVTGLSTVKQRFQQIANRPSE